MALLDDVKTYLEANSVSGGVTGWKTCLAYLPPSPDQVVYVVETGSTRSPEPTLYSPSIQFIIRGNKDDVQTARTKAEQVLIVMDNATISGTNYPYCFAEQNPMYIGKDENERPMFSINFKLMQTR
jgi:hypothetical protein